MKTESQPMSTTNDVSLNQLQFKNRLLAKYIAPVMIPLFLGITTPVLNTGCGIKGRLQGLEQTIDGQQVANQTQDTAIGGLRTDVTNIQTKLTQIEDANKIQLENQNKTDATQNKNINTVSKTNEEKNAEIEQLQTAVQFLRDTTTQRNESTQDQKTLSKDVTALDETSDDQNIDLAWKKLMLEYLVEYRASLMLASHLGTAMEAMNEAAEPRRKNILKQVLTTGRATSYGHTRQPIHVTIPKEKIFDFAEAFKTIDKLSPNEKIGEIDKVINETNQKIQKMEEEQNNISSREANQDMLNGNGDANPPEASSPIDQSSTTMERPSKEAPITTTSPTNSIQKKEWSQINTDSASDLTEELTPLEIIQTGIGKYQVYEVDLSQLPSSSEVQYTCVIYGVRGIINADKKRVKFENNLIVVEVPKNTSNQKIEIRLTDGMIYVFDTSNQTSDTKLNNWIQSRLDEETDMHDWPRRQANKATRIIIGK